MAISQKLKECISAAMADTGAGVELANAVDASSVLSSTEAGYLDGVTAGTVVAGKAVVATTGKTVDELNITALKIGTVAVGATAAEIDAAADVSARRILIPDGNYQLLIANSGKVHIIADVTADRTISFPVEADGLEYEFVPKLVTADGHDWIFDTGSNTNYYTGGVVFMDSDAADTGDEISLVAGNGSSNSKFQVNLPQPGTRLRFICDGTLWNLDGQVMSTTAPTFADQ